MPEIKVERAELIELSDDFKDVASGGKRVPVQFNPETLKLTYANSVQSQNNASGSTAPGERGAANQSQPTARQFVGQGTTKLSITLWFDVSAAIDSSFAVDDVRRLTAKVLYFMKPRAPKNGGGEAGQFVPPGVRFQWGKFLFDGIVEGIEENVELFSPAGNALRASLALSLVQQNILLPDFKGGAGAGTGKAMPGTRPLAGANAGQPLQQLAGDLAGGAGLGGAVGEAARGAGMVGGNAVAEGFVGNAGGPRSWQQVALANGIENPRALRPGQLIDLAARRSLIVTE